MILNNKVSIVIPVYNKERTLKRCIDSVINQTYSEFEIILLDDGSTDDSSNICKEYTEIDNRIRYYYQNNSGQTAARKKGLEYAKTELVMFIDSDDYIDNDYIEILIKATLENKECDLITSGIFFEYDGFRKCLMDGIEPGNYSGAEIKGLLNCVLYDRTTNSQGILHSMSGKVFKKELLLKVFDIIDSRLIIDEDGIAVFTYVCLSNNLKVMRYAGYHYVQYKESAIHCVSDEKLNNLNLLKNQYVEVTNKLGIYEQIKYSLAEHISSAYKVLLGRTMNLSYEKRFVIPSVLYEKKTRIIIYGAGSMGRRLKKSVEKIDNLSVVGWVDKHYQSFNSKLNIVSVERIFDMEYDYIIVAIENNMIVHDVIELLLEQGIPFKKILHLQIEDYYYESDMSELQ